MISRFIVATIAYLLSLPGLIMALAMVVDELRSSRKVFFLAACWAGTVAIHCLSHIAMSFAWVFDLQLGKAWALTGAALTVLGLFVYPLFQSIQAHGWSAQSIALFWAYGGLFLAPYWVLGSWLLLFHGGKPSDTAVTLDADRALLPEER